MGLVSDILLAIVAALWVLLLPGIVWSFVFFTKGHLDILERLMISFGLGLGLVPISLFFAAFLFAVELTILTVSGVVAILLGGGTSVIAARYWLRRRRDEATLSEPGGPPVR